MTNKEAKEIIESECYVFNPLNLDRTTKINTALDVAIKALEQEPCDDTVSREALYKALYEHFHKEDVPNNITNVRLGAVRNFVKNFPIVVPAPKKCHNLNIDYAECDQFVCSNCGIELQDWHSVERDEDNEDITYHDYLFHYCPNCGAKIGREE